MVQSTRPIGCRFVSKLGAQTKVPPLLWDACGQPARFSPVVTSSTDPSSIRTVSAGREFVQVAGNGSATAGSLMDAVPVLVWREH